ncbi:MAG: cytochrome c family protein [Pseudomonadota bacterium]|nr:cytochrome c family protein [Pseudomonadota bacterium]
MIDSFELNKIAGGVLFALLVIFATRTIVDIAFKPHAPEKPGFEVAVQEEASHGGAPAAKEPAVPIAILLQKASVEGGQAQFKKCAACHTPEKGGPNKVGPNLYGIVGRDLATHEGFAYSDAMKSKGGKWDYETLATFLTNPKAAVPGTKMAFAGLKAEQRADVIAYLRTLSDSPVPLPEAKAEAPTPAAPAETAAPAAPAEQKPQ